MAVLEADATTGLESGRAATSLAQEAGDAVSEAAARWMVGYSYIVTDDITPAVQELDRALDLFAQSATSTDRAWAAQAAWARGAVAFVLGQQEQGLRFYEHALAQARAAGSDMTTLMILSDFAGWLFDLGERARARAMLHESLALALDRGRFWFFSYPLIGLALVEASEGESAAAAVSLGAIEALLTLSGLVVPPAFLQERFARATAFAKRELGEDAFAVAWAKGRADVQGVIAKALGRARRVGAPEFTERAVTSDLSPRQREVLALLVAGSSDRQIAEALFISRRTASHHVTAIMAKLNVRSRGEAAVRAVRDRLI
jgi:DNA-binding CsgD family transcriptional regulator